MELVGVELVGVELVGAALVGELDLKIANLGCKHLALGSVCTTLTICCLLCHCVLLVLRV